MANIATALKEEISRIARKEIRAETEALKKTSAKYRSEIAELKRRLAAAEKGLQIKPRKSALAEGEAEVPAEKIRFSAKGLRANRERLGLSAADMAKLLNVSAATLYNWEQEKTKPRDSQLVAIASVRKMGKKEVAAALSEGQSSTETEVEGS